MLDAANYREARLSADNRRLAVEINDPRLYFRHLDRRTRSQRGSVPTSSPRSELLPRLSPDGTRVVFSTDWEGPPNLYIADADGEPRVLVPFDRTQQHAGGWTPDSRQVVYTKRNETFGIDIWAVDVSTGTQQSSSPPFVETNLPCRPMAAGWPTRRTRRGAGKFYVREFPKGSWQIRMSVDAAPIRCGATMAGSCFNISPTASSWQCRSNPAPPAGPRPACRSASSLSTRERIAHSTPLRAVSVS